MGFLSGIPPHYWWGVLGSASVEILAAVRASASNGGGCPPPYNSFFYICVRTLLALCAGALPVALDSANIITAIYLGAGAPLVFDRAAGALETPSEPGSGKPPPPFP